MSECVCLYICACLSSNEKKARKAVDLGSSRQYNVDLGEVELEQITIRIYFMKKNLLSIKII